MLIAHGAVQLKNQSGSIVTTVNRTSVDAGEFDKICESINDLDSATIEECELETVNL